MPLYDRIVENEFRLGTIPAEARQYASLFRHAFQRALDDENTASTSNLQATSVSSDRSYSITTASNTMSMTMTSTDPAQTRDSILDDWPTAINIQDFNHGLISELGSPMDMSDSSQISASMIDTLYSPPSLTPGGEETPYSLLTPHSIPGVAGEWCPATNSILWTSQLPQEQHLDNLSLPAVGDPMASPSHVPSTSSIYATECTPQRDRQAQPRMSDPIDWSSISSEQLFNPSLIMDNLQAELDTGDHTTKLKNKGDRNRGLQRLG